jgi:hypothetical protein
MIRPLRTLILLSAVAAAAGSTISSASASSTSAGAGGWTYFSDPRALRHAGEDHIGWLGPLGEIQVWTRARGVETVGRVGRVDDHASPAVSELPTGQLGVFWSPHESVGKRDGLFYRVLGDHTGWGAVRRIPTNSRGRYGWTYANPVRVGARLMLFWRGGNRQPTYATTRDGEHWSGARTLLVGPPSPRAGRERPYARYFSDGKSVHVAYNEAHPSRRRTGLYYLRLANGKIHDAAGTELGRRPLDWARGDKLYLGDRGSAWVMDVATRPDGAPVIVYVRKKANASQYRYVTWADGHWNDRPICTSPRLRNNRGNYPGGASLNRSDPRTVYVSRKVGAHFEIDAMATADRGLTWASTPLSAGSRHDNIRPTGVIGASAVVWMSGEYAHYRRFNTRILVQEANELKEKRAEGEE